MIFDVKTIRELDYFSFFKRYINRIIFLVVLCLCPMLIGWLIIYHGNILIGFCIGIGAIIIPAIFIRVGRHFYLIRINRNELNTLMLKIDLLKAKLTSELRTDEFIPDVHDNSETRDLDSFEIKERKKSLLRELERLEFTMMNEEMIRAFPVNTFSHLIDLLEKSVKVNSKVTK